MSRSGGLEMTRGLKRALSGVALARSFFSSDWGRRLRKRLYQVPAGEVERVGSALDRAGVVWYLAGGWGIDALVGRRTRHHGDLDVCVEVAADGETRAVEALAELGYEVSVCRAPSGHRLPYRSVLRDRRGRTVDLILVTCLDASPTDEDVPVLRADDTSTGELIVRGRSVRVSCLSPELQVQLHGGYLPQQRDRRDVTRLCQTFDVAMPPIYQRQPEPPSFRRRLDGGLREMVARARGISAVVVLVPDADEVLRAVGGSVPGGMPAHVTLTYPFVPPRHLRTAERRELREIAGRSEPAKIELAALDHHELVTFLTVQPEEPFRRLAGELVERWPEYPPYGDPALDVPPHLTLGFEVLPDEIADSVEPFLPIETEIDHLTVMTRGLLGRWRIAEQFPLGGGPSRKPDGGD